MPTLIALFLVAATASAATFDVVVYGGTAAGVTAAVQASRMSRSVALVAPEKHLGGAMVEGLGSSDINNHWFRNDYAIGGLAAEFYRRIGRHYSVDGPVYKFESHVAESVVEEMLRETKVRIYREHRLQEPLSSAVQFAPGTRTLQSITTGNGTSFEAHVFVDATIEGDLIAAAGVETVIGRESNSRYGETRNGIRGENAYRQFPFKLDPYWEPGNPKSGLLPTIQDEPLGNPGDGDHRLQGYCFRLCLTRNTANQILIRKPSHYDPRQYELYRRYAAAGGTLFTPGANLPNGKTDLGSWHDLSANLYGMNFDYPGGSFAVRAQIYQQHRDFTYALLWFLANDPALPERTRAAWAGWGLCKDEFTDNDGWPRQFYVRDARRMVNDHVMTEVHTRRINPLPVPDPVAVAYWPPDTHHVRRIVRDGAVYNEGFVFGGEDWGPFGISWQSMLPREREASNLITPTVLASSHVAYGAIRLEWTFLALGQAAGTAAALAAEQRLPIHRLTYQSLRTALLKSGQVLSLNLPVQKDGPAH